MRPRSRSSPPTIPAEICRGICRHVPPGRADRGAVGGDDTCRLHRGRTHRRGGPPGPVATTGGPSSARATRGARQPISRRALDGAFGDRLMFVRMKLGLKRPAMAERLTVPASTLATWEKGVRPRDGAEIARRYEQEFGVDRHWILYGDVRSTVSGWSHKAAA